MTIANIPQAERPFSPDETLCYYDGPLLFWLPAPGQHLLTLALLVEKDPWPFLVSELDQAQAKELLEGRLTLQKAVLTARAWHYFPDYGAEQLEFRPLSTISEDWLPGDVMLTG